MRLVHDSADIPHAFAAFDKVRRFHTQRQVKVARYSGGLYQLQAGDCGDDWDEIKTTLSTKQNFIWNHDLEADVREVERIFKEETTRGRQGKL